MLTFDQISEVLEAVDDILIEYYATKTLNGGIHITKNIEEDNVSCSLQISYRIGNVYHRVLNFEFNVRDQINDVSRFKFIIEGHHNISTGNFEIPDFFLNLEEENSVRDEVFVNKFAKTLAEKAKQLLNTSIFLQFQPPPLNSESIRDVLHNLNARLTRLESGPSNS